MSCCTPTNPSGASGLSGRVARLRADYLASKPNISASRALAFTETYKRYPGMPPIKLRALAFKRACETAPLAIFPEELIVSHPAGRRRGGEVSPDIAWRWVRDELDTLSTRAQDPYEIDEDTKRALRETVFPYWEGRSVDEISETRFREAGLWSWSSESFVCDVSIKSQSGGGDTCPGYDIILLSKGFGGVMAEARERLAACSPGIPEDIGKIHFYEAMILTCEGAILYAERYADYALELAAVEADPRRRAELERIARVCRNVPANPPSSFQEALQSVWFAESLFTLEENQTGISLGRADQYLYPFYRHDIDNGVITEAEASELLCCWLIKMAEVMWLCSKESAMYFAGYQPFINLVVGGQKRHGGDACNELTYMIMDASKNLGLYQPALATRIHNASPQKYLKKIVEVVKSGIGFPACHFDDMHIKQMLSKGFSYDDARDYCLMGCVEPQKSGRIYQWTSVGYTNWPVAIEFVLNNGVLLYDGTVQGLQLGGLEQYDTFEKFEAAVKRQVAHITELALQATLISQCIHRDYAPKPLVSALVEGCMESGKNVMDGGAVVNAGPGLIWTGLADYADSMAAVKKLVYEDKACTLEELAQALRDNFVGHEKLLKRCLDAPKYGNDDDEADFFAKDIVDFTQDEHKRRRTLYSRFSHGTLSISNNTPQGMLIGALPCGRLAGAPLSDGISPGQQRDVCGPTAVIKSVSKVNVEAMEIGQVHNFKIMKGLLDTPEGEQGLINLLRTASLLGNGQMQFSYVDDDTLRAAQADPAQYKDLMIRVAGYSAFFVELCKDVQDEIISRTMLRNL